MWPLVSYGGRSSLNYREFQLITVGTQFIPAWHELGDNITSAVLIHAERHRLMGTHNGFEI